MGNKIPNDLLKYDKCITCDHGKVCGSSSMELIFEGDIEELEGKGIKVVAIVYDCHNYKPQG